MSVTPSPYSHRFDLAGISARTVEIRLKPSEPERAAIANWLGALSVESFEAVVRIVRTGDSSFSYDAEFAAGVTQACVITLEPVASTLEGDFHRSYLIAPRTPAARREAVQQSRSRKIEVLPADEDEPELVAGSDIDLAAPILEELALALDPYPKAPGAELPAAEGPQSADQGPFAVLGKLKQPGGEGGESARAKPAKRRSKS